MSAEATQPGNGSFDARAFRNALGRFATGVTVITALDAAVLTAPRAGSLPPEHVRAARPRGAIEPPARPGETDAKHAQLLSAFAAATQAGDLNRLMQLLASDVRVVTTAAARCGRR